MANIRTENLETAGERAGEVVKDFVEHQAERLGGLRDRATGLRDRALDQGRAAVDAVETRVEERPLMAIGAAALAGVIIGMWLARR